MPAVLAGSWVRSEDASRRSEDGRSVDRENRVRRFKFLHVADLHLDSPFVGLRSAAAERVACWSSPDGSFADIPVAYLSAQERHAFTGVVNPSGLTPRIEQLAC